MQKTNKAMAKRFRVTASGKIKFGRATRRHCLGHRSRKNKLNLKPAGYLSESDVMRIKRGLPYGALI